MDVKYFMIMMVLAVVGFAGIDLGYLSNTEGWIIGSAFSIAWFISVIRVLVKG